MYFVSFNVRFPGRRTAGRQLPPGWGIVAKRCFLLQTVVFRVATRGFSGGFWGAKRWFMGAFRGLPAHGQLAQPWCIGAGKHVYRCFGQMSRFSSCFTSGEGHCFLLRAVCCLLLLLPLPVTIQFRRFSKPGNFNTAGAAIACILESVALCCHQVLLALLVSVARSCCIAKSRAQKHSSYHG